MRWVDQRHRARRRAASPNSAMPIGRPIAISDPNASSRMTIAAAMPISSPSAGLGLPRRRRTGRRPPRSAAATRRADRSATSVLERGRGRPRPAARSPGTARGASATRPSAETAVRRPRTRGSDVRRVPPSTSGRTSLGRWLQRVRARRRRSTVVARRHDHLGGEPGLRRRRRAVEQLGGLLRVQPGHLEGVVELACRTPPTRRSRATADDEPAADRRPAGGGRRSGRAVNRMRDIGGLLRADRVGASPMRRSHASDRGTSAHRLGPCPGRSDGRDLDLSADPPAGDRSLRWPCVVAVRPVLLGRPASPDPPRRVWRDWVLVGGLGADGAVLEVLLRDDVAVAAGCRSPWRWRRAALLWRRTHPLAVVAGASSASAIVLDVAGLLERPTLTPGLYTMAYVLLLPYALFRWGSGREALIGLAVIAGLAAVLAMASTTPSLSDAISGFVVLLRWSSRSRSPCGTAPGPGSRSSTRSRARARAAGPRAARHRRPPRLGHRDPGPGRPGRRAPPTRRPPSRRCGSSRRRRRARSPRCGRWSARCATDEQAELAPQPGIADLAAARRAHAGGPPVDVELAGDLDDLARPVGAAVYRAGPGVDHQRRAARPARDPDRRRGAPATTTACG